MRAKTKAGSFVVLTVLLTAPLRSAEPDNEIRTGGSVVVSADATRLGVAGKIAAILDKGTTLKVLAIKGDWIGVSVVIDGEMCKGWVRKGDVELENNKTEATSALAKGFWPQFHGPQRDNISDETGLLAQWPDDGPRLLWTGDGIGFGYASVSVAHGLICTAGNIDDTTVISALDGDGRVVWQVKCGKAWDKQYPGTRGTPTIDGDRLYYQSPSGEVVCLDAKTGTRHWGLNTLEKFAGKNIQWGLCESLLIDGDHVICCPGGETTAVVALDKLTGKTVWKSPSAGELAGYASPSLGEWQGLRMIFTTTAKGIIAVNADNGDLLWKVKHETPFDENVQMPIFHDGEVFVSTQVTGSVKLRIDVQGDKTTVQEVWRSKDLDNHHGGVLLLNGFLYGSADRSNNKKWICLEWKTGEMMYAERGVGKGALTYADGMLYCLSENGTMGLVKPTPTAYEIISKFKIPKGPEGRSWAHPVVCGGSLYIRHGDRLYAYLVAR
jgi:outer membrane protein assembly factor BamB